MNRLLLLTLFISAGLLSCSEKKDKIDSGLKSFTVYGTNSEYNLLFNFPKTFVSIRDIRDIKYIEKLDTTDIALNWIFYIQNENPNFNCFYDSLDTKFNIIIKAGPRMDLSNKERNLTYFTVPTISPDKVFPQESDSLKIIYDSGIKETQEKKYRKKKYKGVLDDGTTSVLSEYYYVTTKWQSVLVIVNSIKEVTMDKYILDYTVIPRKD